MLREMSHRVKNSLTLVAAMLAIQARSAEQQEVEAALRDEEHDQKNRRMINREDGFRASTAGTAGAADAAFQRADPAPTYSGGVLVAGTGSHQCQGAAPVVGKKCECLLQFVFPQRPFLGRRDRDPFHHHVHSRRFAFLFAIIGAERVSKDGEKPGFQGGAATVEMKRIQCLQQGFLHKIVDIVVATQEPSGKDAQCRRQCNDF